MLQFVFDLSNGHKEHLSAPPSAASRITQAPDQLTWRAGGYARISCAASARTTIDFTTGLCPSVRAIPTSIEIALPPSRPWHAAPKAHPDARMETKQMLQSGRSNSRAIPLLGDAQLLMRSISAAAIIDLQPPRPTNHDKKRAFTGTSICANRRNLWTRKSIPAAIEGRLLPPEILGS